MKSLGKESDLLWQVSWKKFAKAATQRVMQLSPSSSKLGLILTSDGVCGEFAQTCHIPVTEDFPRCSITLLHTKDELIKLFLQVTNGGNERLLGDLIGEIDGYSKQNKLSRNKWGKGVTLRNGINLVG